MSFGSFLQRGWSVAAVGLLLAAALAAVAWYDYRATRTELLTLLRVQAASTRDTIAAAARSNRAAAREAEEQITQRLLDNARWLAELDRRHELTQAVVDDLARRNHLFRVTVLAADGRQDISTHAPGESPGTGQGQGRGSGRGPGWGPGGPPWAVGSGASLAAPLLSGEQQEASTRVHEGRRAGVARLAAGVRRSGGGAIVINADAGDVVALQRQSSLDALFEDIVRGTADIAYVVCDQGAVRRAAGELPTEDVGPAASATPSTETGAETPAERFTSAGGRRVLEVSGPLVVAEGEAGLLRLGMRLDAVMRAERRLLPRIAISLGAGLVLGGLAFGLLWLRREYGTLSAEHQRAQEALRRRDRLAAMGELAATVAHEVRNPLNAIAMSAQRLRREVFDDLVPERPDLADSADLVGVIQQESRRIDDIVRQFLEFARPPALAPRAVDLRAFLQSAGDAARAAAEARGVSVDVDVTRAGEAEVDPAQLRQVIDNLLRNAIEATARGGRVVVSATSAGRGHDIEVRDTGAGIPDDVLPRVFDLYFTTKPDGTGVGLAVSQQIVSAHGGTIEVESTPGQGTTMRVRLPGRIERQRHA